MANRGENTRAKDKLSFTTIKQSDVPHGRKGKHHDLVSEILADVRSLKPGAALKVPRAAFADAKITNIRAALSRAAEQSGMSLATSSDDENLYVWTESR